MHLYGYVVAYAARAQMVDVAERRVLSDSMLDVGLDGLRQTLLEQLAEGVGHQLPRRDDNQHTDDDGSDGVEDCPRRSEDDGSTDAYRRAHRRQCVAAVMPCVGHHRLALYGAPRADGELIAPFLQGHADEGCHEGYPSRLLQAVTL